MIVMRTACLAVATATALLLGACAAPGKTPLKLEQYAEGAPLDEACAALIRQAVTRDESDGFALAGMEIEKAAGAPSASAGVQLAPVGSRRAGSPRMRADGTQQTLYVHCEERRAYVVQRGGTRDASWFGPFPL